jgi:hypothetical protein
MDDRELAELIRRGASGWRGPSGRASSALYRRARMHTRWRTVAALAGGAAALLLALSVFAGGPGPVIATFVGTATDNRGAQTTDTHPSSEPTPAVEPSPSTKAEPTPAKTDAPPPASHEPTPSPEPRRTTSPEPTPTTATH